MKENKKLMVWLLFLSIAAASFVVAAGQLDATEMNTQGQAISTTASKVESLYQEAYSLIDLGGSQRRKQARKKLEELIELDPNFEKAYLELARIEMKSRWPKGLHKAEKQILIAKSINPTSADVNILLGYVYTNLNKFEEAENLYAEAESNGTDNLWLHANRGFKLSTAV